MTNFTGLAGNPALFFRPVALYGSFIVGFLDDLKRQADALKAQQTGDSASLERNSALTEAACKTVFSYLNNLAPQLNVLKPASHARFTLDRQNAFDALRLSDFRVDSRRKQLRRDEVFEFLVLHWQLKSGRTLQLMKDFLPDIEKLESKLRQSGVEVENEAVRNPDNGKLQGRRYTFVADFHGGVRITPLHDSASLRFQLQNLDGFEAISLELPAIDVGSARMDELARWIAGQPHAFLKDSQNLRRTEA
jgi:hypothetical protein